MTPRRAAAQARRDLARMGRPSGDFDASRYFRGADHLGFYNVGTAKMRALAKDIYRANLATWSVNDALAFADTLIRNRYLDVKGVGIEVMACYRRDFTPALLPAWKRWLARNYSSNWATTDSICGSLIGPLLLSHPKCQPLLRRWSRDRNMWVRRASAVALIPSVRRGEALDLGYEIAKTLHGDKEDLIQKAVGWMLREAGKADPARLERYLRVNGTSIPRTTLRYAIERFPKEKRRQLLQSTRAGHHGF
jgi:3-methyladenine DNA glycosylase AlkD